MWAYHLGPEEGLAGGGPGPRSGIPLTRLFGLYMISQAVHTLKRQKKGSGNFHLLHLKIIIFKININIFIKIRPGN